MEITIIGKGGFAREVRAYIKMNTPCDRVNLIESSERLDLQPIDNICIADPQIREKVYNEISQCYRYKNFYFSKNYGLNVIGYGTIICPDVIITDNVECGILCQFNIQTSIGHDCVIGNFVTTAPKVSISGNVTIGDRVYIGTGAIIKEKTYICNDVIIGAGAVVLNDITESGTYVGIPAKKNKMKKDFATQVFKDWLNISFKEHYRNENILPHLK